MHIRNVEPQDCNCWAEMRLQLWPKSLDGYKAELDAYFSGNPIGIQEAFVLELDEKEIVAFIELNIRNSAEGSNSNAVPYIEAWYVSSPYRGQGFGKQLVAFAERWALKKGYTELASDVDCNNQVSIEAHKRLGFDAVARVVCFYKKLN